MYLDLHIPFLLCSSSALVIRGQFTDMGENRDTKLPCWLGIKDDAMGSASTGSEVWLAVGKVGSATGAQAGAGL